MRALTTAVALLALMSASARAQQVADSAFHYAGPEAAYDAGTGPRVCIDSGHHNFHTIDGRYLAFATLLADDGYRVSDQPGAFTAESLSECDVLVISNAIGAANAEDWSYPHPPAFSGDEITALLSWVRGGGSLLLIVDHAPMPGASGDLGVLLGADMLDAYVGTKVFGKVDEGALEQGAALYEISAGELHEAIGEPGALADHPILRGRNSQETINTVTTFTGHAFHPSRDVQPLLVLSSDAVGVAPLTMNLPDAAREEMPVFPIGGWLQGGALSMGEGRAVVLGEAAMCTAQLAGPQRVPMGMNNPLAPQNAQFCLNVVHWLSGLLDD
ncbi:MAG: hypothetical protein GWN99_11405 [Gemmatimonadetes bacterium]|uniref:DUF4350 domain-containing protein n=1 Tax=Candidatus Kutchimonas denitrificans TaxID=3056748 RepID=A0AAE4Z5D2_9BACT|nr:hypothetical protein [Gemmatimonadota bacterium]NIR74090.1 hypothetical protein [Candidatus Kutchimonas denitrificans]NIS01652.1 hypothetical protein [Gemmatimonadota bacterium]NIT67390.1 hypothetical protein [Gemmatimonadota bacterium]NIU52753.1 hypothetical protein [Gemmatimonadota bacterium]